MLIQEATFIPDSRVREQDRNVQKETDMYIEKQLSDRMKIIHKIVK